MKIWLGIIGRALIEFVIILALVSIAAGIAQSLGIPSGGMRFIYISAATAALTLSPLAALITLFLAFFAFEQTRGRRLVSWLGLLFLGSLLFSLGIGLREVPLFRDVAAMTAGGSRTLRLIPPGTAVQQGHTAVLVSKFEGTEALEAAAVDFGSDYPRLAYTARGSIDQGTGEVDIQGRLYPAAQAELGPRDLVPEASLFAGSWIWDRLARLDSLLLCFAAAGGFLLLAIGLRFLCRITGWPLANALLAAAALAGLMILDAFLSGSEILAGAESLLRRLGLGFWGSRPRLFPDTLVLAGIEALLGLILGAIDIVASPRRRRLADG